MFRTAKVHNFAISGLQKRLFFDFYEKKLRLLENKGL